MIIAVDKACSVRVLYAYFDGEKLKVQFTPTVKFEEMVMIPPPGVKYLDHVDLDEYRRKMDLVLKWVWPVIKGDSQ